MTTQEHLDLIDAVIRKRLHGDGYESYSQAEQSFGGAPLSQLYAVRRQLKDELASEDGSNFHLSEYLPD